MVRGNLAEELLKLREEEGISFQEAGARSGIARSTISQVVNQGLRLKPNQEESLWRVIEEVRGVKERLDTEPVPPVPTGYKTEIELYETAEFREAMGWCSYVYSKRKMGVLVGHPGSGKTTILRHFAAAQPGVLYVEAWHTMRIGDLLRSIGEAIGVSLKGTNYQNTQALIAGLRDRGDLLIAIDEAEYLCRNNVDKFEVLRKIWDNTGTPIILCGTPAVERLLTVGRHGENLAQLYRRKVELKLNGIGQAEARRILQEYRVEADAAAALAAIAADVKHGGMGTFVEILELCLEAAEGGPITAEILKSAKKYKLTY